MKSSFANQRRKSDAAMVERAYASYVTSKIGAVTGSSDADLQKAARVYKHYLKNWLPKNRAVRILDLGCGHGNMLYFLEQEGYHNLEGVDRSPEQIERARKRFPRVVEGDVMEYLGNCRERYGMITVIDLLEHLARDEAMQLLQQCRDALLPGGCLILQTPNAAGVRSGPLIWGDVTHQQVYTPVSLTQLLKLSGFRNVQFRESAPVPHGVVSLCRWAAWRLLRTALLLIDLIETGRGQKVYTRNMLVLTFKSAPANEESVIPPSMQADFADLPEPED